MTNGNDDPDIFDENIEPEDDTENSVIVPIGELIYHQVMTTVSQVMFSYVPILNELGNVRLLRTEDVVLMLEEMEEEDTE